MPSLEKQFDNHLWALKLLTTILLGSYTRMRDEHQDEDPAAFGRMWVNHDDTWATIRASNTYHQYVGEEMPGATYIYRVTNPVDGPVLRVKRPLLLAYLEAEYQRDRPGRLGERKG